MHETFLYLFSNRNADVAHVEKLLIDVLLRKFLWFCNIIHAQYAYLVFSPSISSDCSASDDSKSRYAPKSPSLKTWIAASSSCWTKKSLNLSLKIKIFYCVQRSCTNWSF